MKAIWILVLMTVMSVDAFSKIKTERIEYRAGTDGPVLEGFLAYREGAKPGTPAVIVVHDWMGLGEYSERRAKELAELGYVGFAVDIYGKGVRAKNSDEASKLAGTYKSNRPLLRARVQAALESIRKNKLVDPKRIAAIGYCFGGTTVLELARSGADVKGIVSFHGGLENPTPEDAKKIKAKSLILHGAIDPYVPPKEVDAFQKEMNDAGVDYQFVAYSGAVHSFTNPAAGSDISKGAAYDKKADQRSFKAMRQFLEEVL